MSGETPAVREALAVYEVEVPETERVPSGYRQTDVGVIPEEWDTAPISDIVQNIIDYRGRTPRKLGMAWGEGSISALSARNVKMGFIDFEEETYFGSDALYKRWMTSGDPRRDDIIFTMEAPLGNVALIPDSRKYILSQRTILLQANPQVILSKYLAQVMRSTTFQERLSANATGSTATGIQRKKLETLIVSIPPLHEQRTIAAALSDVDDLISALDKLIAKKRAVKTATMQQLLTGKQRLSGFSGVWEVRRFGDVLTVRHGRSQHQVVEETGMYPVLASGGEIGRTNAFLYDKPSVLIGRKGTIDRPQYQDSPFWTVDTLFYTEIGSEAYPKFVYYKFLTIDWRSYNEASGVPSLNTSTIENIEIRFPSVEEQTTIAAVLSDMDAEIEALEARREKTRQVKRGMMQELLTGRTRLV